MIRNVLVLLAGSLMMMSAADKPDFTGNWTLNVGKSSFGNMPKPQSMTLTAAKKGEVLHSVQTTEDGQGRKSTEGDWFLDGKQHPVDPTAGADRQTEMSKWDGRTLISERRSDNGRYLETIHMTLSRDGKTATERVSVKSPNGNNTSTLIWERK
ncbi:MAG: hypothetical protein M3Z09_04910 [Acidobacteriota bacterium]|nr:hypothetical protein [Acidobacteriota bacterium]